MVSSIMTNEELQEKLKELDRERQLENSLANSSRAQSITVGNAGSGSVELTMRANNGEFLWHVCQPVEVVELIHQLSASIGCRMMLQPREDFSSWRHWHEIDEEERKHLNGFPPFADDMITHNDVGALPASDKHKNTGTIPISSKQPETEEVSHDGENVGIEK
jgi:hypothetical protein